jgi:DNA-binding CsgD family transcriptional regulator
MATKAAKQTPALHRRGRRPVRPRPRTLVVCRMALWQPTVLPQIAAAGAAIYDPLTQAIVRHEPLPPLSAWWDDALAAARQPGAPTLLRPSVPTTEPPRIADIARLSDREREILILLAEGCTNKTIAARLVIAETTVKWYVKQIFVKLGVHNRTQAVARWREA